MANRKSGSSWFLAVVFVAAVALAAILSAYWLSGHEALADPKAHSTGGPALRAKRTPTTTATAPATQAATAPTQPWTPPRFTDRLHQRRRMVRVIEGYTLTDQSVLKAMTAVPRHRFVPRKHLSRAYVDSPLPIGYGQTISQPYIVAEMTRQLKLKADSRVLEVGTGSGYQAAVLTEFTPHVYTIEIIEALATAAKKRLDRLGYTVVKTRCGDGHYGWPEAAPFDAIIVTAAAGHIPAPLIKQLKPGGRMIIPVGAPFAVQSLMLVKKDLTGVVRTRSLMAVRFVPLVSKSP